MGFLFFIGSISSDEVRFRQDLMNIAGTTLSSKLLTHHKDHFTQLAVEAVLRLKGSGNLEAIHVIKKLGGSLADSYLDEGMYVYQLWKRFGRLPYLLKSLSLRTIHVATVFDILINWLTVFFIFHTLSAAP